jgi:hypothetical protein
MDTLSFGPNEQYFFSHDFESNGYADDGAYASYPKGGFLVDFESNASQTSVAATVLSLQTSGWIDDQTRFVSVDYTIVNTDIEEFAVGRLACEFIPSGQVHPSVRVYSHVILVPLSHQFPSS